MLVVLQRTREEHAHEGTHLVVEPVRRGRRDRLVVFVNQYDRELLRESMDSLREKAERFGKLVLRPLAVHHLAQRPFLGPVSPPVLDTICKSGDLVANHGGKAGERRFCGGLLDILEREEDDRMSTLLLAVHLARRPYLLVMKQRRLALVKRPNHLQCRRLAEATRAREQHHRRLGVDEVLEDQCLVHAVGRAREPRPVARPHGRRQKPARARRHAGTHLFAVLFLRFRHCQPHALFLTRPSLSNFSPKTKEC